MVESNNYQVKKGLNVNVRRIIAYTILIILSLLCIFWFYTLFINATRSNDELNRGLSFFPGKYLIKNWKNMINSALPVKSGMINSFIIALFTAVICSYFSTMTAYGIYAYDFKGKKAIYTLMLAFMMVPRQVTVLGFVDLVRELKMDDTFWPLVLPEIAAPMVFYYMIKYMESTLQGSLIEAARMDGCSEWVIFNRIVLPLMRPAVAVQMIFKFVESWNNYFIPAMILHSDNKKTMPVLISIMRTANYMEADNGRVYMMLAFSILPAVLIYLFLSKFIISGVSSGGVKG